MRDVLRETAMMKIGPTRLAAAIAVASALATAPAIAQEAPPATIPETAPAPEQAATMSAAPDPAARSSGGESPLPAEMKLNRPLPEEMTVTAMFLHANAVVRAVMIMLVTASILTWTILLAKGIDIGFAKRRLRRALSEIEAGETLVELHLQLAARGDPLAAMIAGATAEILQSGNAPRAGIKERVSSRLNRIEAACARRMSRATGVLATIGSTAPFVGLFGTVWGIMDSFIGISRAHTTNLAIVAPGIAEALLATAAGLIAAIPAVVIYNGFARSIGGYRAMLGDLAAAVERLVSRDLDVGRRFPNAAE